VSVPSESKAENNSTARLDKWLWAVRLFKSRALASDACRAGSVSVNELAAKPARTLKPGQMVVFRQGLVHRRLVVLGFPKGRVAASLVKTYCEDRTPPEEIEQARAQRVQQFLARERGSGRPTKRDRRLLDHLLGGES
jgi:ribosome-associated heat shock protein Hsp15